MMSIFPQDFDGYRFINSGIENAFHLKREVIFQNSLSGSDNRLLSPNSGFLGPFQVFMTLYEVFPCENFINE